jgi:arylformamidase
MAYYDDCPYLSEDAAKFLVSKGCRLLGMDTPMPDNPKNGRGSVNDSPNHKILLGAGTILVEYLVNLTSLDRPEVMLVVGPLKIRDGDGAPARAFAILD